MSDKEQLLSLWLDNQLTPEQQIEFDNHCARDPEFAKVVDTASMVRMQAQHFQPQQVPDWQPQELSVQRPVTVKWWQSPRLSFASMAMSCAAVAMVLLQVEVSYQSDELTISFAGKGREVQIQQQVEMQLADYKTQQETLMLAKIDQLEQQQQLVNSQLTNYVLSSSRRERREDFAELIKFVNEQRADDQVFYAKQFNKLQNQLGAESGPELNNTNQR